MRALELNTAISESHEAAAPFRLSEDLLRQMADAMPQIVWVTHPDGHVEYFNGQWYDYTGSTVEQSIGEGWVQFFHEHDMPKTRDRWQHALATGEPYEVEYRCRRHDGTYRWFLGRGLPVKDEGGNVVKWFGTCTDIHDKIMAEQELRFAKKRAEEANIAKDEFLANMSHEVRTPLNVILGLSGILSASGLSPKQGEMISTLQLSAEQLLQLINDMLDVSRFEANQVKMDQVYFDMPELLSEIVTLNSVLAAEKKLALRLDIEGSNLPQLLGDPLRVRQILINLVSNAVKFTEVGEVTVRLRNYFESGDHADVVIEVEDTGMGIAPGMLDSIFTKFSQGDSSMTRKHGGAGLGLSISKSLVELMGGTIQVRSKEGEGSCFTVQIPFPLRESEKAVSIITKENGVKEENESASKLRILLVEDYKPNILVATLLINDFGYECDVAENGQQALDMIATGRFGLVLMDVQMPEMNGFQATAALRAREKESKLPRMPVVGMTAHALRGDREKCIEAGMDDYLSKPFQPEELRALIQKFDQRAKQAPAA